MSHTFRSLRYPNARLFFAGLARANLGDLVGALRVLERKSALLDRYEVRFYRARTATTLSWVWRELGDVGRAEELAATITQFVRFHSMGKSIELAKELGPFPEWRIAPFFIMGAGTAVTSPSAALVETEDRQDNLLTVGGGFIFYLSQRFSLRAEYNHHTLLTTRESNQEVDEWKTGFSVSF